MSEYPKKQWYVQKVAYWECGLQYCDTLHQTKDGAQKCRDKSKVTSNSAKTYRERNKSIYKERLSGKTYKSIAMKHGLSVERTRQICFREERLASGAVRDTCSDIKLKKIGNAELSVRTMHCLHRIGIDSIEKLVLHTPQNLLSINNFGRKSLNEIRSRLAEIGLSLMGDKQ